MSTVVSTAPSQAPSDGYKRVVLGLLLAAYTCNFVDRTIIATIGQAIKEDLALSDTQLGMLGGLYFAILYTVMGIPIARLAERYSRVNIIAASVLIWSGFTALCGAATNYLTLALCRFGVGLGEAGCSPPSHSLISDYFEPKRRASALAVYAFGIPLGTMFGAVAGGWIAQNLSWRMAFVLVGLPGLLIALAVKLVIREPERGVSDTPEVRARAAAAGVADHRRGLSREIAEIWAVTKLLLGRWASFHVVMGVTLASFASYGAAQFVPPHYIRNFGLGLADVGLIVGLVTGVSAGLGTLMGGFASDRLARRDSRWYALTPAIGLLLATPLYFAAFGQLSWQATALWLLLPGVLHYTYLAPSFGVIQNMVDVRRRATATAVVFLVVNLVGLGGGPPFTGWLMDPHAAFNLANPGAGLLEGLGGMLGADTAAFNAACPGGQGSPACTEAVAAATRHGLLITVCFFAWAAVHYFLASFGLAKELAIHQSDPAQP